MALKLSPIAGEMAPKYLPPDSKEAAVKMVDNRVPSRNIPEYFNVSVRTIECYSKISKDRRGVERPSGSGVPKNTTPTEDRSIV